MPYHCCLYLLGCQEFDNLLHCCFLDAVEISECSQMGLTSSKQTTFNKKSKKKSFKTETSKKKKNTPSFTLAVCTFVLLLSSLITA